MEGRLLVGVGQLYHRSIVVRPSKEADPGGQIVARKTSRDHDRWNEWLVLYRLVHDGVQVDVCHNL